MIAEDKLGPLASAITIVKAKRDAYETKVLNIFSNLFHGIPKSFCF